jgi:hypothetical protein
MGGNRTTGRALMMMVLVVVLVGVRPFQCVLRALMISTPSMVGILKLSGLIGL